MCTAAAVSQTVNQGHCQSLAIARVEKTQFAGLVAHLLPHLHKALQQHGSHAHGYINKHPAAHLSTLVATIKEEAKPWLPGLDTGELTREGCFTAPIINHLCKVLTAVSGAFNAGNGYQAAAP